MKKVFACLSTFVLMLVAFGLLVSPAVVSAAEVEDGKFIEDPTLEEGEMPLYVMNSIRSSFPSLYDFNAQADPNYNIGRDFYWNEIKVVFPQFDASGATGQFWSVYTQGEYNSTKKTAAATKIYVWAVDPEVAEGETPQVKPATMTGSTITFAGVYAPQFGDQSLSGVRYNVSGQDVVIENLYIEDGIVNGKSGTPYNTDPIYLVVDGNGKVVRGAAHDNYYAAENIEAYGFNSIFGLKDGVIVLRTDIVGGEALNGLGAADADLDREQIAVPDEDSPVLDDFGDPVLDENGNPTYNNKYIDGENPAISMGTRYIFQWYSEEDFADVKVNTVGYMQEGWLADRWDYAYADPNGGYMCISFAPALAKYAALTDAQAAVHNASVRALEAAGELSAEEAAALLIAETEATDETTGETVITYAIYRRPNILKVVIPTNGIMYRYGYLDYSGTAVVEMHFGKFCHLFEDGLLYGRHADYQAYARTFNFTATGLVAKNAVYEGESFYVREESGKYVVEVKPGANIKVSEVVDILGMLGGYGVAGKPGKEAGSNAMAVTSYKQSEVTELEYTMDIDGVPTMRPVQYQYEDYKQALEALLPVLGAHVGVADASPSNWSTPTYGKFTDENIASFFEAHSEWLWFKDYFQAVFDELAAAQNYSSYTAWSPNMVRFGLEMFYTNAHRTSWPATPDFSQAWTTAFEDYCPEKSYRYDTWEDFVADFLKDFNNEVYGKEQVASAADFFNATYLADPAGETAQKMIAFFQSEKWGWLGKEIDNGVAASTWTNYDKTDYRYYRCNAFEYINKTKNGTWPYSCGTFHGMADPDWVGVPLEKDYNKIIYSTEGYDLFDNIELELTVVNLSTGITDDIAVTFQVVENFTPVIRIDASKLSVALGQTSIDLTQAVKAYDVEYKERGNGVYGSDISRQFLEFVYPEGFDPQNLQPGQWTIEAVASCPANPAIKERVEFKVLVIDEKAPSGRLYNGGDLAVVKGSQLTVEQLFVYAYDNAHGDLLRNAEIDWNWYVINTDYDPATSEIGETCSGSVTLYDKSGNTTKLNFTVTVTGAEGGVVEVPGPGTGDITVPGGDTVAPGESCISFAYVSSFIAAAGLALLILKKRH